MSKPQPLKISVERTIEAEPETVYAMIADVTRIGQWSPECTGAEWLDGATSAAVGVRFKGANKLGSTKWTTKPTITEAEPGRVFAFKVPGKSGPQWRYEFSPTDDGGTTVTQSMAQQKPVNALIRMLQRRNGVTDRKAHLADGMATTLDRLAESLEPAAL